MNRNWIEDALMRVRRVHLIRLVIVVLGLTLVGCAGGAGDATDGRIGVVASFYPLAEAAQQVGGRLVSVTDLTPPASSRTTSS